MLLNNSTKPQPKKAQGSQYISSQFQKIVNFIEWSQFEDEVLQKFEHILQIELQINKQEFTEVLTHFKIDHELTRALVKMCDEIQSNLVAFYQPDADRDQDYTESHALSRVNLLIRTSTKQVKCLCHSLAFLHFVSSNMDYYNRIIHWFQKKQIFPKLSSWREPYSTVLKQKVFTIISILYIKYGQISAKSNIIQAAINQRQKYLQYRTEQVEQAKNNKSKTVVSCKVRERSTVRFYQSQSDKLISLLSESILEENNKKSVPKRSANSHHALVRHQIVTIYLRFKLIEGLIFDNKACRPLKTIQTQQIEQVDKTGQSAQKYYQILTLIYKFKTEVKSKCHITQLKMQLQYFNNKADSFRQICQNKVKQFDKNLYVSDDILGDEKQKQKQLQFRSRTKSRSKISRIGSQLSVKENKEAAKKGRSQSLQVTHKSVGNVGIKQQLAERYFKENEKNRDKSKSAKIVIRDRSKSKIMAKILANTFQNAKNALRQIQFQIKTNNFDRFSNLKPKSPQTQLQPQPQQQQPQKSKLVKHKKTKQQIYSKLTQNNRMKANVCKSSLISQIQQLGSVVISNPCTMMEENKKCIIQHKVSHKVQQQPQMYQAVLGCLDQREVQDQQRYQVQSKLEVVKYLDGVPHRIVVKIRPKDKNYLVQLTFHPHNESQFSIQMSLPKSNNIYTDRYHTIWPTIKYLLRKKMLQYPLIRQNQYRIFETRNPQEQRHVAVREEKLVELFGPIQEDQLYQICTTLMLICKFYGLLVYSKLDIVGRKYEFTQFQKYYEIRDTNNLKSQQNLKKTNPQTSTKNINEKPLPSLLNDMKKNMWLMSTNEVYIGSAFIKQRSCRFMCFQSDYRLPFYIFQVVTYTGLDYKKLNEERTLRLQIRILPASLPQTRKQPPITTTFITTTIKKQKKYLHSQTITLTPPQIQKYNIDVNNLAERLKLAVNGQKIDQLTQDKLMQICWIRFSRFDQFYTPGFFDMYFREIGQPCIVRADSDPSFKMFQHYRANDRQCAVKICQNFLQFNLQDLTQNSFQLLGKQCTHRTITVNKKSEAEPTKPLSRIPSINTGMGKITQSQQEHQRYQDQYLKNRIRFSLYQRSEYAVSKELVELNFLTPFKAAYNWTLEIGIINLNKGSKHKIVLTAQDFYSLGYPYKQNPRQTLQQIQKLCKQLQISRSTPIPKIIVSLKPKQLQNLSIEVIDTDKDKRPSRNCDRSRSRSRSKSSIDREDKDEGACRYRSVYQNKMFNKTDGLSNQQLRFQTSGSLSQIHTQAYVKTNCELIKRRPSMQSLRKCQNPNLTKSHKLTKIQLPPHKSAKSYLTKIHEYKWHLCTLPSKLTIPKSSSPSTSPFPSSCNINPEHVYNLMHLSYINIDPESEDGGFVEIQVSLSQVQYKLVWVVREKEFYQLIRDFYYNCQTSFKKVLSTMRQVKPKKEQDPYQFKEKEKVKGGRWFSLKEKKLILGMIELVFQTSLCQQGQKNQKSQDQILIERLNNKPTPKQPQFQLNKEKQQLKSFLSSIQLQLQPSSPSQLPHIPDIIKCSQCPLHTLHTTSSCHLGIGDKQFPLKIRLHHEYDAIRDCVFDVYLHAGGIGALGIGAWGKGLGIQVGIPSIHENDHLQLVQLSKLSKSKQMRQSDSISISIFGKRNTIQSSSSNSNSFSNSNSNSNSQSMSMSHQLSNMSQQYIKQDEEKQEHRQHNGECGYRQIKTIGIQQLIKQYRQELVDPGSQIQAHVIKNTILLSRLARFMMEVYVHQKYTRKDNCQSYNKNGRF